MSSKFFVLLFILAVFTRFFGINWDQGYFSHPDENNMATALSQLSSQNLNPHFFAYGQFPLYLGYFSLKLINIPNTFSNSIYVLRFYSAIFSLFFLYFAYLLSIKLFSKSSQKVAGCIFVDIERGNTFTGNKNISKSFCNKTLIFLLFLIFSPGLIQIAHFGTTESLLSLIFIANLYFLIKIYKNPKFRYFVITAILSGIGLGSKITAIFFIWPIILMGVYKKQFLSTSFFILAFSLIFLITSPYNIIDINDFLSSMRYETDVATGNIDVFYTRQFVNTTSYIFQFTHIFPYVVGLPVFFFSFFGLFIFIKKYSKKYFFWLLILLPAICYFLYFGQLFVKWTRFMAPIFFIFPLFTTLFISRLKSSYQLLVTSFCLLPGLFFMFQYFLPNPRISASNWINNNLYESSTILSESGNVVDLNLRSNISINNFDFYSLDNNYQNKILFDNLLIKEKYILIPSRRIFKNQYNNFFPYSKNYYEKIFSDSYKKIYQSNNFDFILNYESAEETFTVFDFPTLRIYKPNAN